MKLFASFMAVGMLAAPSAFAQQTYVSPGDDCIAGDPDCPAPIDTGAPLLSGRSATEVAPPFDPALGRETIRSEEEVKREGATGTYGRAPYGSGNSNR